MTKDSTVEEFNHCCSAGGDLWFLNLGFDDWIGSADEFCFDFHSKFKKSNVVGLAIHDRNGYTRSMDDCISVDA